MDAVVGRWWKTQRMLASSHRSRFRSEMIEEIKAVARQRLAEDGAKLSLRGVARDMGMAASALYRYFPSRDDLLTALILDAYEALADAVRAADASTPRASVRDRWMAVAHAVRDWGLAHPAEYSLLYGGPVPGYAVPRDTIAPASAVVLLLAHIAADAAQSRNGGLPPSWPLPEALRADLRRLIDQQEGDMSEDLLERVLAGWTHLAGLVSFEVFGRLQGTIEARLAYFNHQMGLMADLAGVG